MFNMQLFHPETVAFVFFVAGIAIATAIASYKSYSDGDSDTYTDIIERQSWSKYQTRQGKFTKLV